LRVKFLGGAQEVGRSCVLVECKKENKRILLDCGIKLGKEDEYPLLDKKLVRTIDAVIITHAHLDHCGFLPHLTAMGFRGKIYSTKPTRDLCQLLLADYSRICSYERKRAFTQEDVIRTLRAFSFLEYWKKAKIFPGVSVTLYRAGHILGAAGVRLEAGGKSLYYTGDFSLRDSNLLDRADTDIEDFDYLIMESTYGAKNDVIPSLKTESKKLADVINETAKKGGKTIIPAFGVGRSQELMLIIDNYMRSGAIHHIPCFVDGMIKKASRIYRHNVLFLKEEIPKRILLAQDDPFASETFRQPTTKDRSDVFREEAALVISTSGMMTGGPILRYFERLCGDWKNTIILVGYQAEETPGRQLVEGEKTVQLPDGRTVRNNMRVEKLNFSAHADRAQLMEFVKSAPKAKRIFVVHGEARKSFDFAEELRKRHDVTVPKIGDEFQL